MILYSEDDQKAIDEFKSRVQMSFQMTEEFMQICSYLSVNKRPVFEFLTSFLSEKIPAGQDVVHKNESKKLLEKLRGEATRTTKIGENEQYCKPTDNNDTKLDTICLNNAENNVTDKHIRKEYDNFHDISYGDFSEENDIKVAQNNNIAPKTKEITAYVEADIIDDPLTKELIKDVKDVRIIKHYKDIFNAKEHDFKAEKKSGSFIVAKNRDALVYPGAPFCQSFGNEHFYYTSCVKNCIFDCDYCYLQGLYPCGYPVFFVNLDDYFKELTEILKEHSVYLCVSYDTDLLALENKIHYVEKWVSYAHEHQNLKIEIRTKCGNVSFFSNYKSNVKRRFTENCYNVIFAWTISPKEVITFAEKGLPSVESRLKACKAAASAGFPVRLCFDPMIFHPKWRESYTNLFKNVFNLIDPESVLDVSVGVFRISNHLLRRMRIANPMTPITAFPYVTENGAAHYGNVSKEMTEFAKSELMKYLPGEKIFIWDGNN